MKFADKSGHPQAIGLMAATLGAVLFSTKAVLVKLAFAYMVTPETLLSLRLLMAAPFYIGAAIYLGRGAAQLSRRDRLEIAFFGLIGYYAASVLDFVGFARILVDLERLVLYTYPLIVILLSALAFGRPVTVKELTEIGVAYLGLSLVVIDDRARAGVTRDGSAACSSPC
jgi:drug/metabolite transporter (DMT)-like permease